MAKSVYARFGTSALTGIQQTQRQHMVKGGETLPSIAAYEFPNEGYSSEIWRQIAEANELDDLDALATNMTLVIPAPKASST